MLRSRLRCDSSEGLPAPPLTTAHPTPALYPLTLLHLSPCFLRSPHDLYLQLSVSLMSVSPENIATTRAGPWSVCSPLCSPPWHRVRAQQALGKWVKTATWVKSLTPPGSALSPCSCREGHRGSSRAAGPPGAKPGKGQPSLQSPGQPLPLSLRCFFRSCHPLGKRDSVPRGPKGKYQKVM